MRNIRKRLSSERFASILLKILRMAHCFLLRAKLLFEIQSLGKGCKVFPGLIISGGKNIRIGKNCFIGRNVLLDASGGLITIGDNVEIRDNVRIYSGNVSIEAGVTLGEGAFLNGTITIREKAWIARGCDITGTILIEQAILGPQVSIAGGRGHQRDPETQRIVLSCGDLSRTPANLPNAGIRVLAGSWVGQGAILLKEVTINRNMVVGAGSVVTKSFPEGAVVAGNPAKPIVSKLSL